MWCVGLTYEVLLVWVANRCLLTPILQPSKGILVLRHAHNPNLIGGSGLNTRLPWHVQWSGVVKLRHQLGDSLRFDAGPRVSRPICGLFGVFRSEERRVGKACVSPCRSRWSPDD